ncbi:hypothetical protein [Chondrinema litorale]|uniref:hypothetical protein n=1 Tax=Chondrinema litorale TaxID=2994555 RepID=UPI0025435D62|nr:hypothetical protein [Chondrinema litorale]UZR97631.1 hypothetical protein OQ292_27900 [Chondrinema litorale]
MNPFLRVFTSFIKAEHDYHYQQLEKGSIFRAQSYCPHQQYDECTPLSISKFLIKSYFSTNASISGVINTRHTSRWCGINHTLAYVMYKRLRFITSRHFYLKSNLIGNSIIAGSG